ncbi:tesmin [Echinops telfairi]|uniref:Tesmin n=1 Tax=Echinops telfairi TaxID=9371 RepID=A0ABM0J308_ECHTE|nr:tesmin [Echinops telfairi]
MEETPMLGALPSPESELESDLLSAESHFAPENMALTTPAEAQRGDDDFHVFKDAYLGAPDPKEPLLRALHTLPGADPTIKVELPGDTPDDRKVLAEFLGVPEPSAMEDTLLARAPPPAYNVHFLSSLLAPHRSPAVMPLGAWPREGAGHPGVRVIPVEIKEAGGPMATNDPEEASFGNSHTQEPCSKFPSSQELEDPAICPQKDPNPMVICQLKGGTQMLCIDHAGTRELTALHLVPQYQDQNNYLQPEVTKPRTTLVGRFLPVPAKLNLLTQQLENGAFPPVVSGAALPGPAQLTLAG